MIEMVVVLLLMGIIAATVLGRAITTSDLDLNSETDKIRNHLRYAQAEAMKRSNTVWGMHFDKTQSEYWLFRGTNPNSVSDQVRLPGVNYAGSSNKVNLPSGISFSIALAQVTVFFDRIGKPYTAYTSYTDETQNTPVSTSNPLTVSLTTGSQPQSITITPETGLIR
jgi:type II secretory pathway pseudopilin PulG